ncbi:Response regulator receiver [Legionella busanensis]|uniref:Response regulator receiver n=1 Tax=Legionella busanensis TaxID=190655 RepID=A0A378KAA4_9GAMM|nr:MULTISPECIES: response regulator [Legionella]STX81647.1 Response regulator receiver [Legionella busanensis]
MINTFRFLVVDSSLVERIIIRSHLLKLNYSVDMASDIKTASELILIRPYNFILLDKYLDNDLVVMNLSHT